MGLGVTQLHGSLSVSISSNVKSYFDRREPRSVYSDKLTRLKSKKACWFLWRILSINLRRREPLLSISGRGS